MSKRFFEGIIDTGLSPGSSNNQNYNLNDSGQLTRYQKYYNDMVQYTTADQIVSECAEITFYNMGASNMVVNGILFAPNTGISFDGNTDELDVTKYNLTFSGAGQNIAFVVRKCYQD